MSTTYGTTELGPASAKRQVYSPFEAYWNSFQEWRRREKRRAQLRRLSDSELADIGLTRDQIEDVATHRDMDPQDAPSAM